MGRNSQNTEPSLEEPEREGTEGEPGTPEPSPEEPSLDEDKTEEGIEPSLEEPAPTPPARTRASSKRVRAPKPPTEVPSLEEPEDTDGEEPETPPQAKPAVSPVLDKAAPMGSKARAMRDKLAAEPKVRVFIPLASGEKQGVTQSVILNGYPMYIRKGTYVDVPQSVAEVLEAKLKHKMSVENHPSRVTADGEVKMTTYGN